MEPFTTLTAVAAPLDIAKIDTGVIVPGRFLRIRRRPGQADYADAFLHDLRFDENDRLRRLLREHGVDPDAEPGQTGAEGA